MFTYFLNNAKSVHIFGSLYGFNSWIVLLRRSKLVDNI